MVNVSYFSGKTLNGSICKKTRIYKYGTAWSPSYYYEIINLNKLTDLDLKLYKSLDLPNWYYDTTSNRLVINLSKYARDFGVTEKIVKALGINEIVWQQV